MNPRRFYKMTGSGNDFVFLDGREHRLADWPVDRIRSVCDRRRGVGADGLVLLNASPGGAVRLHYFNADGSQADLCGNAALCTVRLGPWLGLVPKGETVQLETDAGRLEGQADGPGWSAGLHFASAAVPGPTDLALEPGERLAFQGTIGVPHTIVLVEQIDSVDVVGRGRQLRFHPARGASGSNVNFVGPSGAPETADWAVRTYERGVEAETLACGTGTVAVALAFARAGLSPLPVRIRSGSGAIYTISGRLDEADARDVWLVGEGRLVFVGELEAGAE